MSPQTKPCGRAQAEARLKVAEQFIEFAEAGEAVIAENPYRANGQIANYVQAGIAAADALCCVELQAHSTGDNHADAIDLIKQVRIGGAALAKDLATLVGMKTSASYGARPMKAADVLRARRAAGRLVTIAKDRVGR